MCAIRTNDRLIGQTDTKQCQTTLIQNDELSARTLELQELMKQHRIEQLQLSHLLEIFSGRDLDQFVRLLTKPRVNDRGPVRGNQHSRRQPRRDSGMVHTIVPILDESGTVVDRLFIYSDKPDGR
jgi:hypothetical protein